MTRLTEPLQILELVRATAISRANVINGIRWRSATPATVAITSMYCSFDHWRKWFRSGSSIRFAEVHQLVVDRADERERCRFKELRNAVERHGADTGNLTFDRTEILRIYIDVEVHGRLVRTAGFAEHLGERLSRFGSKAQLTELCGYFLTLGMFLDLLPLREP